jgi:hypothetical protein
MTQLVRQIPYNYYLDIRMLLGFQPSDGTKVPNKNNISNVQIYT